MKKPVCSDTYELSDLQVHRLSKETIYLPADIIKCSVITVLLRFVFFFSSKKPLQLFAAKMLHKRFRQQRESDGRISARLLPRLISPLLFSCVCCRENVSGDTHHPTHKTCQRGREEGPGWHFLPLTSDPASLEAQCDRGGAATFTATLAQ